MNSDPQGLRAAQAALQSDDDIFAPHPFGGAILVESAQHGPVVGKAVDLSGLPARDPFNGLPDLSDIAIAAPARPDMDFPGARVWPGPKLVLTTEEERELQEAYPDKSWTEIIAILLAASETQLVRAGELTHVIADRYARASELENEARKLKDEKTEMIKAAGALRDKALRLVRRGR